MATSTDDAGTLGDGSNPDQHLGTYDMLRVFESTITDPGLATVVAMLAFASLAIGITLLSGMVRAIGTVRLIALCAALILLLLPVPLLVNWGKSLVTWFFGNGSSTPVGTPGSWTEFGFYVIAMLLVTVGYGGWMAGRDFWTDGDENGFANRDAKMQNRRALLAWRVFVSVLIGIGIGMLVYRYAMFVATQNTAASGGDPGSFGQLLSFMALVLTILTGISVHYISSSMSQISEQRREIDSEITLASRIEEHSRLMKIYDLNTVRNKLYQRFNEDRLEAPQMVEIQPGWLTRGRASVVLRNIFRQHSRPTERRPLPQDLEDIYGAIAEASRLPFLTTRLIDDEARQVIREFHVSIIREQFLRPDARQRFQNVFEDFMKSLDDGRV
ncbi:MAG: hypothetical protein GC150_07575 [Rhizobiales bacterium]|nr:hypothetical protein [Hyphomicrobiales bacterium]